MSEADSQMGFYRKVQKNGKLRSPSHASRWSDAVLRTLGLALDRRTKKQLAKALPEDLAYAVGRVFWLVHFRNAGMTSQEFLNQVARRSGNTDIDFARYPTAAVFGALKELIEPDLNARISETLSPELQSLWQQA